MRRWPVSQRLSGSESRKQPLFGCGKLYHERRGGTPPPPDGTPARLRSPVASCARATRSACRSLGRCWLVEPSSVVIQRKQRLDLIAGKTPPLADARAEGRDLSVPHLAIHILRPERPRPTLGRSGFVNRASAPIQEDAVSRFISNSKPAVNLDAAAAREDRRRLIEERSQPPAILQRQVDIGVVAMVGAAASALLTLEAEPLGVKRLAHGAGLCVYVAFSATNASRAASASAAIT